MFVVAGGAKREVDVEGRFDPKIVIIVDSFAMYDTPQLVFLKSVFIHLDGVVLLALVQSHYASYFQLFDLIFSAFDLTNYPKLVAGVFFLYGFEVQFRAQS